MKAIADTTNNNSTLEVLVKNHIPLPSEITNNSTIIFIELSTA